MVPQFQSLTGVMPMNDRVTWDSTANVTVPTNPEAITAVRFGSTSASTRRHVRSPLARAASTKSRLRSDSVWAQNNLALQRGAWWWFVPAGACIALLGMALTLVNFGIDEIVNPRLRSTGLHARSLRRRGIRPRVGFTPVVREVRS